jgi:hypothetical protein
LGMMIYHHCWDKACLKFMPFVMICCEKAWFFSILSLIFMASSVGTRRNIYIEGIHYICSWVSHAFWRTTNIILLVIIWILCPKVLISPS